MRGAQRRSNDMPTRKASADPDIEPEYDLTGSMRNPYAARYHDPMDVEPRARNARVTGTTLVVTLVDGRELRVPVHWYPRVAAGSPARRANDQVIEGGRALHWPDLDEDVGVAPLLATAAQQR